MSKQANEIVEWGRLKAFQNDTIKDLIGLDIETIDNELFIIGYYDNKNKYKYTLNNFHHFIFDTIIKACQNGLHIATWTRYDNNIIFRTLLDYATDINRAIERVQKYPAKYNRQLGQYDIEPIIEIDYKGFKICMDNMIRECIMFRVFDSEGNNRIVWSYNIKNLYEGLDIEKASKNAKLDYYSKIGTEYHVIDKKRFESDFEYKTTVLKSNELDARACRDLGLMIQNDYYSIFGSYPKSLISAGSLARSSVIDMSVILGRSTSNISFKSVFNLKNELHQRLLDYAMRSYHGGKIDSYAIGYVKEARVVDITSAYPHAMQQLKSFELMSIYTDIKRLNDNDYSYLFVRCDLVIKKDSDELSTPFIYNSKLFKSNINPYGYVKDIVLTKYDYEFVKKHNQDIEITIHDFIGIKTVDQYTIFKDIIDILFDKRIELKDKEELMKSDLVKRIINSLYGITQELTDVFDEDITFIGYRAGDYFNPVISSHITSFTRVQISDMNNNIINKGGSILLNMTDSIMYHNTDISDLCSDKKILGTFENGGLIEDLLILGSGRYEYKDDLKDKDGNPLWTVKTRGFSAPKKKDKSYYIDVIKNNGKIHKSSFVSIAKSSQHSKALNRDFTYKDIGLIYDDTSDIDPFNLGGKRYIAKEDFKKDITSTLIKTKQVYLDRDL